jgi:hypothetical protein
VAAVKHPAPQDRELVAEHGVLDLEGTLARLTAGDPEPPAKMHVCDPTTSPRTSGESAVWLQFVRAPR